MSKWQGTVDQRLHTVVTVVRTVEGKTYSNFCLDFIFLLCILGLALSRRDAVGLDRTIVAVPARVDQDPTARVLEGALVPNHRRRDQTASLTADQDHKTGKCCCC